MQNDGSKLTPEPLVFLWTGRFTIGRQHIIHTNNYHNKGKYIQKE